MIGPRISRKSQENYGESCLRDMKMRWPKSTRKSCVLILALFVGLTVLPRRNDAQAEKKALSKDDVLTLLKGHVSTKNVAERARERGIDFQVSPGIEEELLRAGATDELLLALREIAPMPSFSPPPPTSGKTAPVVARVETSNAAGTPSAGMVNPKDGLKYVWIPSGTFQMGCSPEDDACSYDEKPSHQVKIGKGFWMGQTDVTVGAYKRFAGAAGRQMPAALGFRGRWPDDSIPIVNVSWDDAQAYCTWAGGRLPTEAEWEYAGRGGSTGARYGPIDEIAWYSYDSGGQAQDVAQKRANGFGLYDMLGNVFQWVNDWYDANYYQRSLAADPPGPSTGSQRVLRGGFSNGGLREVRVSRRFGQVPRQPLPTAGFRCVWEQVGHPSAGIEKPAPKSGEIPINN